MLMRARMPPPPPHPLLQMAAASLLYQPQAQGNPWAMMVRGSVAPCVPSAPAASPAPLYPDVGQVTPVNTNQATHAPRRRPNPQPQGASGLPEGMTTEALAAAAQVVPLAAVGAVATCGASQAGAGTLCRPKPVKLGPAGDQTSVVQQVIGWPNPTLLLPPTTPPSPQRAQTASAGGQ